MRILKVNLAVLEPFGETLLFKCIKPDAVVHRLLLGLFDVFEIPLIERLFLRSGVLCKLHLLFIELLRGFINTGALTVRSCVALFIAPAADWIKATGISAHVKRHILTAEAHRPFETRPQ